MRKSCVTTVIPRANVSPSVLKPMFFDKNRYLRSMFTYSRCVVFTDYTYSTRKSSISGASGGVINIEG
jgi:hypothetical protein